MHPYERLSLYWSLSHMPFHHSALKMNEDGWAWCYLQSHQEATSLRLPRPQNKALSWKPKQRKRKDWNICSMVCPHRPHRSTCILCWKTAGLWLFPKSCSNCRCGTDSGVQPSAWGKCQLWDWLLNWKAEWLVVSFIIFKAFRQTSMIILKETKLALAT